MSYREFCSLLKDFLPRVYCLGSSSDEVWMRVYMETLEKEVSFHPFRRHFVRSCDVVVLTFPGLLKGRKKNPQKKLAAFFRGLRLRATSPLLSSAFSAGNINSFCTPEHPGFDDEDRSPLTQPPEDDADVLMLDGSSTPLATATDDHSVSTSCHDSNDNVFSGRKRPSTCTYSPPPEHPLPLLKATSTTTTTREGEDQHCNLKGPRSHRRSLLTTGDSLRAYQPITTDRCPKVR